MHNNLQPKSLQYTLKLAVKIAEFRVLNLLLFNGSNATNHKKLKNPIFCQLDLKFPVEFYLTSQKVSFYVDKIYQ